MEYVALFLWLVLCITCGALMHTLLESAANYSLIKFLSAPGIIVRKVSMTAAALAGGATVTHSNAYHLSERDVAFNADGMAKISRFLVPLAPLFACAVLLCAANVLLARPVSLTITAPTVSSLDAGGALGFLDGLFAMVSGLLHQIAAADWQSFRWYALLLLAFSLSLGAGVAFDRFKECFVGAALLVGVLALLCTLFIHTGSDAGRPAVLITLSTWVSSVRTFLMDTGAMAVVMMLFGLLAAILVGISVRLYEMLASAATDTGRSSKPSRKSADDEEEDRKAA